MSNLFRRVSLVLLCSLVVASSTNLFAQAAASASPSTLANGTLYVSGQSGRKSDGSLVSEFSQQVSEALKNVQSVLRQSGMDFGNVVWMNIYLTNAQDIDAMNDVYWKSIGSNPPARTVLVVAALPGGENVEIGRAHV